AALVAHAEAALAQTDASLGNHEAAATLRRQAQALLAEVGAGPNAERDQTLRILEAEARAEATAPPIGSAGGR
ncbi:MAG: hypothetical protein ACTHMO_05210, partial [Rhodanobacteraceae bacterium]